MLYFHVIPKYMPDHIGVNLWTGQVITGALVHTVRGIASIARGTLILTGAIIHGVYHIKNN